MDTTQQRSWPPALSIVDDEHGQVIRFITHAEVYICGLWLKQSRSTTRESVSVQPLDRNAAPLPPYMLAASTTALLAGNTPTRGRPR